MLNRKKKETMVFVFPKIQEKFWKKRNVESIIIAGDLREVAKKGGKTEKSFQLNF